MADKLAPLLIAALTGVFLQSSLGFWFWLLILYLGFFTFIIKLRGWREKKQITKNSKKDPFWTDILFNTNNSKLRAELEHLKAEMENLKISSQRELELAHKFRQKEIESYEDQIKALQKELEALQEQGNIRLEDFNFVVSSYQKQIERLQAELAAMQEQKKAGYEDAVRLLGFLPAEELTKETLKTRMMQLHSRLHQDKSGPECSGLFKAVKKAEQTINQHNDW